MPTKPENDAERFARIDALMEEYRVKHEDLEAYLVQARQRHADGEDTPRLGSSYRCHICRLELALDPKTNRLAPMPMRDDEPPQKHRRTT